MTYVHAEGYSGGALKHGPFALIEGEEGKDGPTPVIMIILDDDHGTHMRTAAEEVIAYIYIYKDIYTADRQQDGLIMICT